MWQERKRNSESKEKFEDGVLRVDGCFRRHDSRDDEYLAPNEDSSYSFGRSAVWAEKRLMNNVAILFSKGLRPRAEQDLEDFIREHKDELGEEVF